MSDQFEINARIRARSGTHLVRRLRREGDVPAVIYGGGKDNVSIAIDHDVLFHSLDKEEFHSTIIIINTDGNKERAILRDVQRHPHKINILHADFQRVDDTKILTMSMPIHFIGEEDCVGVKNDGGVLSHFIHDVEISCLPNDLPEHLELNVASLGLNDSLHLTDIYLPEGVNITALMHDDDVDHDLTVVSVLPPRVEVEPSDEEDEDMADTEEKDEKAADEEEDSRED